MPFDSETKEAALARLKSLDAPVGPVEHMIEKSITGRYSAMSVLECVEELDMSKTDITRVTVKPGEPLPHGDTDWERVKAMTDEEVLPMHNRSVRKNWPRCAGSRA